MPSESSVSTPKQNNLLNLLNTQKYSLKLIITVMAAQIVMPVVVMIYLMNNQYYMKVIATLNNFTSGFIIPTIVNYLVYFIVLIAIFYFWPGKISANNLGLQKSKIPSALFYIILFWIIPQLLVLIYLYQLEIQLLYPASGSNTDSSLDWELFSGSFLETLYMKKLCSEDFLYPSFTATCLLRLKKSVKNT